MPQLTIINGEVLIPERGMVRAGLAIDEGKIVAIAKESVLPEGREIIDASGLVVMPGIIDPHVHLGFGHGFEKDCRTETRSALLGGVTTIGCFIGGTCLHSQTFPELERIFNTQAFTDVFPHLCINTEEQRAEIPVYVNQFGVTSFKFFMFCIPGYMPSQSNAFILNGLRTIAKFSSYCLASIHAEEASILTEQWNNFFRSGKKTLIEWAAHNPVEAEELGVIIAASLAAMSQCRVNIVHLATAAGLARIRALKRINPFITVETITLYLTLNCLSEVAPEEARWSPAVRSSEDQEALWRGVEEGIIDTIGTDQDCVTREGLQKFIQDYGVSGSSAVTPLLLPLLLTEGYHNRGIPLEKLISKITINPAQLWGIYPQKGTIAVGSDADLVLVDLNREFEVDYRKLFSVADWSLYQGKRLKGFPVMTIKGGEVVMKEGKILPEWGKGKRIKRG